MCLLLNKNILKNFQIILLIFTKVDKQFLTLEMILKFQKLLPVVYIFLFKLDMIWNKEKYHCTIL